MGASLLRDAWLGGWVVWREVLFLDGYVLGWVDQGLDVDVEKSGLFMLGPMKQEFMALVDSHTLTAGEEPDFETSRGQHGDAEKGVWGSFYYCDLSENGAEVGIVGAVESRAITEDYMKRPLPTLRSQIELGHRVGIGD